MSREQVELRRLARTERSHVLIHARCVVATTSELSSVVVRRHPVWAACGAAALALFVMSGRKSRSSGDTSSGSWRSHLGALGLRLLPDLASALAFHTEADGELADESPDEMSAEDSGPAQDPRSHAAASFPNTV